jgi:HPt (histidine-containing phosphotransfer) domain-containing protein
MPPSPPIDWIASPPLAPGDEAIDREHLSRMTLGNAVLEREVLSMFLKQTAQLLGALAARADGGSALVHTLKGSARAIGAFRVATAAGDLETAIRSGGDPSLALAELDDAAAEARASIEAILERP